MQKSRGGGCVCVKLQWKCQCKKKKNLAFQICSALCKWYYKWSLAQKCIYVGVKKKKKKGCYYARLYYFTDECKMSASFLSFFFFTVQKNKTFGDI